MAKNTVITKDKDFYLKYSESDTRVREMIYSPELFNELYNFYQSLPHFYFEEKDKYFNFNDGDAVHATKDKLTLVICRYKSRRRGNNYTWHEYINYKGKIYYYQQETVNAWQQKIPGVFILTGDDGNDLYRRTIITMYDKKTNCSKKIFADICSFFRLDVNNEWDKYIHRRK